jgi:hypothetical protein
MDWRYRLHIKTPLKLLVISTVMSLIFAVLVPVSVLADDGTPPTEVPVSEVVTTPEPAATENAPDVAVPTLDGGSTNTAATEAPAMDVMPTTDVTQPLESIADITQTLADANAVLVDQSGNSIPLSSNQAADLLSGTDPWFDAGSGVIVGYSAGACAVGVTECNFSATPIQAAINDSRSNAKTIFVEQGNYSENVVIAKQVILLGQGTGATTSSFSLQSGADITGSGNIFAPVINVYNGAKIQNGIDLASPGGTVNVYPGLPPTVKQMAVVPIISVFM